jgi:hypothetical protein
MNTITEAKAQTRPTERPLLSKLLKWLGRLGTSMLAGLILYFLLQSTIFLPWRQRNPIDTAINWLGTPVSVHRIIWLAVLAWSLATSAVGIYFWIVIRHKKLTDPEIIKEMIGPHVPWDHKRGIPRKKSPD